MAEPTRSTSPGHQHARIKPLGKYSPPTLHRIAVERAHEHHEWNCLALIGRSATSPLSHQYWKSTRPHTSQQHSSRDTSFLDESPTPRPQPESCPPKAPRPGAEANCRQRSKEHTTELHSLMPTTPSSS